MLASYSYLVVYPIYNLVCVLVVGQSKISHSLNVDFDEDIVQAVRDREYHVFTGNIHRFEFNKKFQGITLDESWKSYLSKRQIHFLNFFHKLFKKVQIIK